MSYTDFQQLFEILKATARIKTVAAVCPEDLATLEALIQAHREQWCNSLLIGDREKIVSLLEKLGASSCEFSMIHAEHANQAAELAVTAVREGKADFLMKGNLDTSVLLKVIVQPDSGLHDQPLMSHLAFFQIPNYHKLMVLTDSGMVLYPTLDQKKWILQNAIHTLQKLQYTEIRIGMLAAVEKVHPKMKETVEAAAIVNWATKAFPSSVIVEGPISYDLWMSPDIASKKQYQTQVSGNGDIMVVDQMVTGNILGKALILHAGAKMAGVVVGAKVPIALNSRGSSMEEKHLALMLSALLA